MTSAMPPASVPPMPSMPPAAPNSRNGFGTTALVLGIVGLLFSLVPFVGVIAWPLVILGLVFTVLGWQRVRKGEASNRGVVIAGGVTAALGLLVCIVYTLTFAKAVSEPFASGALGSNTTTQGATISDGPASVPALPQPQAAATSAFPVAQLGQSFNYPDGLAVSVAQPQRYTASQSASPTQYRGTNVLLLTVTVTNNTGQPVQINPLLSGPKVTYGGQEAEHVYDNNGFLLQSGATVLPGKAYTYRYLYGASGGPADIQAEWTRELLQAPAIFTGQG